MWVDADLIFLDMGLRLEQVASAHPGAHVILSAGGSGMGVQSSLITKNDCFNVAHYPISKVDVM
jgi:hypothetical protein